MSSDELVERARPRLENDPAAREPRLVWDAEIAADERHAASPIERHAAEHIERRIQHPPLADIPLAPRVVRHVRHALKVSQEPDRSGEHRVRFRERFAIAAARATRSGAKFAIGTIDIGCPEGDAALMRDLSVQLANRLKRTVRQTDTVMFESSGKIAFVAEDVDVRSLDTLGGRVFRTLSEPVQSRGGVHVPSPAVGMALWRSHDDDADRLLADAQWELSELKRRTGKGWRIAGWSAEPTETSGSKRPRRIRFRVGTFLQRTVGWVSLLTIGWVVASYSGMERAKALLAQIHQIVVSLPLLR